MIPETVFDANECQALLDYIERLERHLAVVRITAELEPGVRKTDEESAALDKLHGAARFYVPEL